MALSGKVALITGAAQGLGKAFSEALLKKGAKVFLADIQSKKGEITASAFQREYGQDRAMFVKCDVTSVSEMKGTFSALLSKFGQLDIMVNNAGIGDEENPARTIDINVHGDSPDMALCGRLGYKQHYLTLSLGCSSPSGGMKGVITGTTLAVDVMSKEKGGNGGVIINVASTAGVTPKAYMTPTYTASKFAVSGYTQCWSHNPYLKKMGLRFACLCPAFTDTDILQSGVAFYPEDLRKLVQMVGINEVSAVVEGFMQLVEDEQCNGAVMVITQQNGITFYKKPLALSKM